jgi:hypothetical protein
MEWSIVSMGSNPEAMKREAATMEEIESNKKKYRWKSKPGKKNRAIRAAHH